MRRDYFICVFLFLVAASLSFVCLLPTCFSYDGVLPRDVSVAETILSLVFAFATLLAFPIIFAVKRKFWAMLGFVAYGILPYLPGMFLPGLAKLVTGTEASTVANVKAFLLRDLYIMCYAPFVGVGKIFGNNFALALPKLIMPCVILLYAAVFLFRFYREAYLAELSAPAPTADQPAKEKVQRKEPEILGTVISAPVEEHKKPTDDTMVMNKKRAPARPRQEMDQASARPASDGRPNVRRPNISFDDIPDSVKGAPKAQPQAVPQGRKPAGAMPEGRRAAAAMPQGGKPAAEMPEGRKASGAMPEGRKAAASVNEGRKPEGALPDPNRQMKAAPKDSVIELGPPPKPQPRKDGVIELGPPPKDVPPVN